MVLHCWDVFLRVGEPLSVSLWPNSSSLDSSDQKTLPVWRIFLQVVPIILRSGLLCQNSTWRNKRLLQFHRGENNFVLNSIVLFSMTIAAVAQKLPYVLFLSPPDTGAPGGMWVDSVMNFTHQLFISSGVGQTALLIVCLVLVINLWTFTHVANNK